MGQILFRALIGGISGFVAWALCEGQFPKVTVDPISGTIIYPPEWGRVEAIYIMLIGALVGAAVGGLNGWMRGSNRQALIGGLLGLLLGALGSTFGTMVGGALVKGMFPTDIFSPTSPEHNYPMAQVIFARVVALTPVGIFLGAAIGAAGLTARRFWVGAGGGLLGGFSGAILFDTLSKTLAPMLLTMRGTNVGGPNGSSVAGEIGMPGRAVYGIALGFFIALFIGIVDRVTRTAWIRLVLGRKEGKEWVVDSPQTFLGRSETAQVPLLGDPNVAPMHACITKQGQTYMLMDGGSPIGTYVNGQRVQQATLFDGAQIQIGPHILQFMLRQGSAPQRAAEAFRNQAFPMQPAAGGYPQQPYPGQSLQAQVPQQPIAGQPYPGQPTQAVVPPGQPTTAFPAQPAGGSGFILVAIDGPLAGQRFDVRGRIELGREATGLTLGFDFAASRKHASVTPSPGGLSVEDLGSTNGTFVNGQKVQYAVARPGDTLKVGSTSFRVEGG